MSTSTREILDREIASQSALRPEGEDARQNMTRYIFVPFRDRALTPYYQSEYNLEKLRQGIIQRIERFERKETNHKSVMDVPMDRFGRPMSVGYGNHGTRIHDRKPVYVVDAILRAHNPNHISAGMEDNGICEVRPLLGVDDQRVRLALQEHFLPAIYPTVREQRAQLSAALAGAGSLSFVDGFGAHRPYSDVGEVLSNATETAFRWAVMKYRALQNAVEEWGRTGKTGKSELSPFDVYLCSWLEMPQPRLESILQGGNQQQAAQQPIVQVVQPTDGVDRKPCIDCGEMIAVAAKVCRYCSKRYDEEVSFSPPPDATDESSATTKNKPRK